MRACLGLTLFVFSSVSAGAQTLTGPAAFGDWRSDAPGVSRLIRAGDVPPAVSRTSASSARVVARPKDMLPKVPDGYAIAPLADNLDGARTLRFAPDGTLFVAQTSRGTITALRLSPDGASVVERKTFVSGLDGPFGLGFYPPGPEPKWLYRRDHRRPSCAFRTSAATSSHRSKPEMLVRDLPDGGHSTRDLVFSRDGTRMFVSVGSQSNVAEDMGARPGDLAAFEASHGTGATWGDEEGRASVLVFDAQGKNRKIFANGLRNCVGMTLVPASDKLWCATNERDLMGDDLPPDYATEVREGAFFGWPWFYIGANIDKRPGLRPDLASKVSVPDVLIQAHSAPLGIAFYEGDRFPAAGRSDAFVALHGSWNRAKRTGYKIVRLPFKDGKPTGAYEDFVTGFVLDDQRVWGRPVSVTGAPDGSLLFSEDGNGSVWRVTATR